MLKGVHLFLIGYAKAFDKIVHEDRVELLWQLGLFEKNIKIIQNLHWNKRIVEIR